MSCERTVIGSSHTHVLCRDGSSDGRQDPRGADVQHIRFSVIVARVLQGLALPFLVVGAGLGWVAGLIDDEDDEAALEEREIRKFDRR
jgi:hypothetical protein